MPVTSFGIKTDNFQTNNIFTANLYKLAIIFIPVIFNFSFNHVLPNVNTDYIMAGLTVKTVEFINN